MGRLNGVNVKTARVGVALHRRRGLNRALVRTGGSSGWTTAQGRKTGGRRKGTPNRMTAEIKVVPILLPLSAIGRSHLGNPV